MRSLQVGAIGSAAGLNYSKKVKTITAKTGNILVFSAEKDCDSLSTAANRSVKKLAVLPQALPMPKKLLLGALLPYWLPLV